MKHFLAFLLKHKTLSLVDVKLGYFNSESAQLISSIINLKPTDDSIIIEETLIKNAIDELKREQNSCEKAQQILEKEIQDLKILIIQCINPEVASKYLNYSKELHKEVKDCQIGIKKYQTYIDKLEFILSVYTNNTTDWDLCYYSY